MAPLVSLALATLVARAAATFQLYAYGTDIGGLRVYYQQGEAYIGSPAASYSNVTFTKSSTNSSLLAATDDSTTNTHFLALDENAATFSPLTFPPMTSAADSSSTDSSASSTTVTTTGFGFYGALLFHIDSDTGAIETNFYAVPTDTDGVYSVNWKGGSASATDGSVSVALRTTKPSTAEKRGEEFVA